MGTVETIGIRALKAHLSEYLEKIQNGASVTVTERGRPVARMVPIDTPPSEPLLGLLRAGRVAWSGCKVQLPRQVPDVQEGDTVGDLVGDGRR